MKISTKLELAVFVPILMASIIIVVLVLSFQESGKVQDAGDKVRQIRSSITELNHYVISYILYDEERPKQQFLAEHDTLTRLFASTQIQNPEQQHLLDNIRKDTQAMKDIFSQLVSNNERSSTVRMDEHREVEDRLVGLLLLKSYEADSDASLLRKLVDDGIRITGIKATGLIFLVIVLTTIPLTIVLGRTRRGINSSLSNLTKGTAVIGSGHLDYTLYEKGDDELADLSRTFNRMTTNLKDVTTSRSLLEMEITERRKAEEIVSRQNAIVKAINLIFRECLRCDTKEELALFCLNIAEELTQSKFGFIGEVGADGFLHDTAMNNTGWELCSMHDKTGHRRPPGDFKIHGLYGKVLSDGKGLFCNDPLSHPDSIGTPVGHPGIKAFLGVPLINDGKIIGMIGLANREGGYCDEDLAYMEALAPAIVEANMRKLAEENLRQRTVELETLKDDFIGMVSHELKTPITVIIGALSTAEKEGLTLKEVKGLRHDAAMSAEALAAIIDNLLELSRFRSNRLYLQTERTQIEPVVNEVIQKLKNRSAIHHLTADVPSELPTVTMDNFRIEMVLHNLVDNAIKYSPKGGKVRIFVRHQDAQLVIGVSDQGIGILPEDQPKLFQGFQRLEVQSKYNIDGVGFGLRVCRILVEFHNGRIWMESQPGKGSTFFFALPVAETPEGH